MRILRQTCLPSDTGTVKIVLQNISGCDSVIITSTVLQNPSACMLGVDVKSDTIGCQETSGMIIFKFDQPDFPIQYTWTDANGNQESGAFQASVNLTESLVLPPGNYTFDFLDASGRVAQVFGFIFKVLPLEINTVVTSNYNGQHISCFENSDGAIKANIFSGGLAPYRFQWSDGSTASERNNLSAGWYYVDVTDFFGCSDMDSIQIVSPEKLQLRTTTIQPDCHSGGLGTIQIADVDGGTPPYRYRVNNGNWINTAIFPDLQAGLYTVNLTDSNQCEVSISEKINTYREATVIISNDTTINLGDSVQIEIYVDPGTDGIQKIYWEGADCAECYKIWVTPQQTAEYSVVVTDTLGCMVRKTVKIQIKLNQDVYIPNVFSPGTSGENQKFTIYGSNSLQSIRDMRIYDRWGNLVYSEENLTPNDPTVGWDGSFRGTSLQTGVYVYLCVLEFSDGKVKTINGDILLLRK
jgi:gliding motility-associated-like protein